MVHTPRLSVLLSVVAAVAVVTMALVCAPGCGPSVQLIHEGNLRFEHCYRLDLDEHVAPSHRRACWSEWLLYFSNGQTRDRVEYAKRRLNAMDSGDGAIQILRLEDPSDAGPPSVVGHDPAPIPSSAHTPPPSRIQTPSPSAAGSATAPDAGLEPPAASSALPDAGKNPGRAKHPTREAPSKAGDRPEKGQTLNGP